MPTGDEVRLRHMLDAARAAVESAARHQPLGSQRDPVWAFGIVKLVEIIGEAASRVSTETRAELPSIPWAAIVGMRNRLVHAYFDIDHVQIERTLEEDLPVLIADLELRLESK